MRLFPGPFECFPPTLCPLLGILARSDPSTWRAIALLNAFEFFAFEARFGFPPLQAVLLLGYLHPLLPALWKSPARKYRRRRGNGGRAGSQRGKGIRTRRTQSLPNIHGRRGKRGKTRDSKGCKDNSAGVASLRGQGTPAYPARLRSERARNSSRMLPAARAGSSSRSLVAAGA